MHPVGCCACLRSRLSAMAPVTWLNTDGMSWCPNSQGMHMLGSLHCNQLTRGPYGLCTAIHPLAIHIGHDWVFCPMQLKQRRLHERRSVAIDLRRLIDIQINSTAHRLRMNGFAIRLCLKLTAYGDNMLDSRRLSWIA